jgi:hypothetical protein
MHISIIYVTVEITISQLRSLLEEIAITISTMTYTNTHGTYTDME